MKHKPAGSSGSSGGQFDGWEGKRSDPGQMVLDDGDAASVEELAAAQWDDPDRMKKYGERSSVAITPWGKPDSIRQPAPGIAWVDTPSHGGISLSHQRNSMMPPALRQSGGFYEEDVEVRKVQYVMPEAFAHMGGTPEEVRADAAEGLKNWFPDEYEALTAEKLTEKESYMRQKEAEALAHERFLADHADDFVMSNGTNASYAPEGHYVVWAKMPATGEERRFLVSKDEAVKDHVYRNDLIIDPKRHMDVTDVENVPFDPDEVKHSVVHEIKLRPGATKSQVRSANEELDKKYRFPDGVRTLREDMERSGVVEKSMQAGKSEFYVHLPGGYIIKVRSATYKAIDLPDTTTVGVKEQSALRRAEEAHDRAQADYNMDAIRQTRTRLDEARRVHQEVSDAERKRWGELQDARQARQKQMFEERWASWPH